MEHCVFSRNRVPVYYDISPDLHTVKLSLYLRCGAMYESAANNGITHFFEHIVFRNIDRMMGGCLYSEADRHAVDFNASTYKEFMCFDFLFLPDSFDFVLQVFEKVFGKIVLSSEEIDVERDVVKAEIYEEDEKNTIAYLSEHEIWSGTSLTQTVLGTCSSLNRITVKKLNNFRNSLFSAGNMFVYFTGSATPEMAFKTAEVLSDANISQNEPVRGNMAPVPEDFCSRNGIPVFKRSDYTKVQLSFDFFKGEASSAEMSVLYDYLFTGNSCGFYNVLNYKSGLIYSHSATLEEYGNIGNIRVSFDIKKSSLEAALTETVRILNSVKTEKPDLTSTKMLFRLCEQSELDDCADRNWSLSYYKYILNESSGKIDREKLYLDVTSEKISGIAAAVFTTKRLTTVVKGDKSKTDIDSIRKILSDLDRI